MLVVENTNVVLWSRNQENLCENSAPIKQKSVNKLKIQSLIKVN